MALSRISSGQSGLFSGSYASGDLLVVFAYNNAATVPSTPTGYTSLTSATQAATNAMAVFYKVATSGSETYPSAANWFDSLWAIYRGQAATPFVQTGGQSSTGSSSTISYSGIATFQNPGADWVLTFGCASGPCNIEGVPPTSMTLLASDVAGSPAFDMANFDSNGVLSSYGFNSKTLTAAKVWMTKTTELVAAAGGGGSPNPLELMLLGVG